MLRKDSEGVILDAIHAIKVAPLVFLATIAVVEIFVLVSPRGVSMESKASASQMQDRVSR